MSYSIDINSLHTAYADVLKFLEITNCYFKYSDSAETIIIKPIIIDVSFWIVMAANNIPQGGKLVIHTDEIYALDVETEPYMFEDDDTTYVKLCFTQQIPEELQSRITKYTILRQFSEKRKEERYDIGLANWELFGLEKAEQKLFHNKNSSIKCIISNISVHGALVTGKAAYIRIGENVAKLYCTFNNPIDTIMQSALIVRIDKKTSQLYRYSLRFIEPVSLGWQGRFNSYVLKL